MATSRKTETKIQPADKLEAQISELIAASEQLLNNRAALLNGSRPQAVKVITAAELIFNRPEVLPSNGAEFLILANTLRQALLNTEAEVQAAAAATPAPPVDVEAEVVEPKAPTPATAATVAAFYAEEDANRAKRTRAKKAKAAEPAATAPTAKAAELPGPDLPVEAEAVEEPAADPEPSTPEIEELLKLAKANGCPIAEQHLQQFAGLPDEPIYCWVHGKVPDYGAWNTRAKLATPRGIVSTRPMKPGWVPTGYGMVSGQISGFVFIDADVNPENPLKSEETFRNITGHGFEDLPKSATRISGKPGRFQTVLRVPPEYWAKISGWSFNKGDLEIRWERHDKETHQASAIQSVIAGPHPDSTEAEPLWFRWEEGLSPAEVGIADAPAWLLLAMVFMAGAEAGYDEGRSEGEPTGRKAGEPGPCDLLDPKSQRKLLREMSEFWPHRGGSSGTRYQARWVADEFNGLLAALHHLFGAEMAEEWLGDTKWFQSNNNWGNHPSFEEALRSIGKSKNKGDQKSGWGKLWRLATRTKDCDGHTFAEPAWSPPKWALPPKEMDVENLATSSAKLINKLRDGLTLIDGMADPAQRLAASQEMARSLGKSGGDMAQLLQAIEEGGTAVKKVELSELLAMEKNIQPVIRGLLARGCLTVLASEGGVAKTSVFYRMAAAICTGTKFAGELDTVRGPVVVIQKDEADANAKQKAVAMDLRQLPEDRETFDFYFDCWHPGMMPELKQWIKDSGAVAVFMDSLGTLVGGGDRSLNDFECGLCLYRLNRMAAELNVAVVMSHHTKKRQNESTKQPKGEEQPRNRVRASDLYGSSYIHNAATDVWGLVVDGGDGERPVFALEVIKARSGLTQKGDLFHLQGNLEDLSFTFDTFNLSKSTEALTGSSREKVLKYLKGRRVETAVTIEDIHVTINLSSATVKRVLRELYSDSFRTGVDRVRVPGTGGTKPAFAYYQRSKGT